MDISKQQGIMKSNYSGVSYYMVQYNMISHMLFTAVTEVEYKLEFDTKDTSYLALMGELWGPFCEDFI